MIPHMTLWKFCHKLRIGELTFYYDFRDLHVVLRVEVEVFGRGRAITSRLSTGTSVRENATFCT